MSICSFAQNFEDVMLWRALGHIKNGFYIDIGAQDPINDSVSKAFYLKGWRGLHVEPATQYVEKLRADRSDEQVLQAAVSSESGEVKFLKSKTPVYLLPPTKLQSMFGHKDSRSKKPPFRR